MGVCQSANQNNRKSRINPNKHRQCFSEQNPSPIIPQNRQSDSFENLRTYYKIQIKSTPFGNFSPLQEEQFEAEFVSSKLLSPYKYIETKNYPDLFTKLYEICYLKCEPILGNITEDKKESNLLFFRVMLFLMGNVSYLNRKADTAKKIGGIEPRVAMLSFSTKGSGNDAKFYDTVSKVQKATELAKTAAPDLALDGEFQFDAAVAPEVGELKAPGSKVAGHANTFIFPNINAGNIGYKICQRMGGWMAIGPICQGFAKPLNDLSRGCNVEDIIATVAVTALQA